MRIWLSNAQSCGLVRQRSDAKVKTSLPTSKQKQTKRHIISGQRPLGEKKISASPICSLLAAPCLLAVPLLLLPFTSFAWVITKHCGCSGKLTSGRLDRQQALRSRSRYRRKQATPFLSTNSLRRCCCRSARRRPTASMDQILAFNPIQAAAASEYFLKINLLLLRRCA